MLACRRFHILSLLVLLAPLVACRPRESSLHNPSPSLPASLTPPLTVAPHPSPTLLPFFPAPSRTPSLTPTLFASPTPTPLPRITLLFSGAIVPGRCVQAAVEKRGQADFLYDGVREFIRGADLAVGVLNATISDVAPKTGCRQTFVLVSDPRNADAMRRAGFDLLSVATNHIKNCGPGDCGDKAFFETLAHLRRVGIQPVGAGKDLAEAMQPVVVTVKGVRFGFVSLGMVEPLAFAGENTPGIAVLNEANLRAAIAAARQLADVVIALPHWGSDYGADPNWWQLEYARVAVEAGADLVVGNHAHVVQAVQEIDGVQVFYALGSLIFDQVWSRETQQSVFAVVTFEGKRYLGYELIPVVYDEEGAAHLAGEEEAAEILERIEKASQALK